MCLAQSSLHSIIIKKEKYFFYVMKQNMLLSLVFPNPIDSLNKKK